MSQRGFIRIQCRNTNAYQVNHRRAQYYLFRPLNEESGQEDQLSVPS